MILRQIRLTGDLRHTFTDRSSPVTLMSQSGEIMFARVSPLCEALDPYPSRARSGKV